MGAGEFAEWVAYSHLEPFGERRADARAWMLAAQLANAMAGAKIELTDILKDWRPPDGPQDVALQVATFFRVKEAQDRMKEPHGTDR